MGVADWLMGVAGAKGLLGAQAEKGSVWDS